MSTETDAAAVSPEVEQRLAEIRESIEGFGDWERCKCSECQADGRAHAVNESASLAKLSAAVMPLVQSLADALNAKLTHAESLAAKAKGIVGDYFAAWKIIQRRPLLGRSHEQQWAQDGTLAMNVSHLAEDLKDMAAALATSEAAREANGRELEAARAEAAAMRKELARVRSSYNRELHPEDKADIDAALSSSAGRDVLERLERAEAVAANLPVTDDGVSVVPEMEIWSKASGTRHVVKSVERRTFTAVCDCHGQELCCVSCDVASLPDKFRFSSTREAALAPSPRDETGGAEQGVHQ